MIPGNEIGIGRIMNALSDLGILTVTAKQAPDPAQLARKWAKAFGISPERTAYAVAELTPVAADFLAQLQGDYNAQQG